MGHWTLLAIKSLRWGQASSHCHFRITLYDTLGGTWKLSHDAALSRFFRVWKAQRQMTDIIRYSRGLGCLSPIQLPSLTDCGVWAMIIARGYIKRGSTIVPPAGSSLFNRTLLAVEILQHSLLPFCWTSEFSLDSGAPSAPMLHGTHMLLQCI